MKELSLNQLLRYGLCGGVFLILTLALYEKPRAFILEQGSGLGATVLLVTGLTAGSVIYALHRALPYPVLYRFLASRNERRESMLDMDIRRWRNNSRTGALQPRMGEWADQVHFLYCVAWAGFSAILVRPAAGWECPVEREFWVALAVAVLVLVAGIVHHFRYLQCEKRVFEEDAKE